MSTPTKPPGSLEAPGTPPTHTPPIPRPFFSLPREIRDIIYHNVFLSTRYLPAHFPPHNPHCALQLFYKIPTNTLRDDLAQAFPSTAWFLSNKQMTVEALQQFFLHAVWYLGEATPLRDVDSQMFMWVLVREEVNWRRVTEWWNLSGKLGAEGSTFQVVTTDGSEDWFEVVNMQLADENGVIIGGNLGKIKRFLR
ncbi:hypothetical protein BU23DRAFT_127177 [Bimuria novae-zelandiae CBS 107.79]|uniref:Uncharacterized protein n=1 Tax=Bimuria novae-zelandiae CBS 107.79 TaxID=1447943 RepID=A0A6A5VAV4_9PLEO|nr:hypothetical protein BU23DRAFT_127177 [Bimuria novae-zelandiae CBS 107.79]